MSRFDSLSSGYLISARAPLLPLDLHPFDPFKASEQSVFLTHIGRRDPGHDTESPRGPKMVLG